MSEKAIITYRFHQEAFEFLGNETVITESTVPSDFKQIWNDFFEMGGYAPILPYAVDPKPINVWYLNEKGEHIYSQGLFVQNVDKVPEGYKLARFDGGDYLVVTTEWMETNEKAVGDNGNGRVNRYAETAELPEGYVRSGGPILEIEKENADTPEGSRYEVWVPMEPAAKGN